MLSNVNALDAAVPLDRLPKRLADSPDRQIRRAVIDENFNLIPIPILGNQLVVVNKDPDA